MNPIKKRAVFWLGLAWVGFVWLIAIFAISTLAGALTA